MFELAPAGIMGEDLAAPDRELDWMLRLAELTGRTVCFGLMQHDNVPNDWKRLLDAAAAAYEAGIPLRPQVPARPLGLLTGLQTFNAFHTRPTYLAAAARADGDLDALVAALRDPATRRAILDEPDSPDNRMPYLSRLDRRSISATRRGTNPIPTPASPARPSAPGGIRSSTLRPHAHRRGPRVVLPAAAGVLGLHARPDPGDADASATAIGLGDGGAHVGAICDASNTTFMLTHWARDRSRGDLIPLATAVRKMTLDTATIYGLGDRGVIAEGKKADLNVIDFERLQLQSPTMVHDLPAAPGACCRAPTATTRRSSPVGWCSATASTPGPAPAP